MNILFVITKSEIGGAQRFVQEQILVLKENNYNTFLVTNKYGWLTDSVGQHLCKVGIHAGIEKKMSLNFCGYLYNFITNNKIDLVICSSANAGLYGRVVSLFTKSKSIYVTHGWSSVYNGGKVAFLLNFIEKMLSKIGDSVLCVSQNDYMLAIKKIGVKKSKLHVIPNSILPKNQIAPERTNQKLKLVMVCRIDHPKRPDLLVKAVQKIRDKVELTIVGTGIKLDELKSLVSTEDKHIILKGEIPTFDNYHLYDAFALISLSEGLPIAALEAMSSGLALILSNVGGCYSLIENNGVIVENNEEAILNGLNEVMDNVALFKFNSLDLFNRKFNLRNNVQQYLSYYNAVINK